MGFADCLSPDSPCENCNCCFIAASTSVHFFYFFLFFILLLLHILLLLKLFSTSFPFSSALFCFFLLYGTCVQTGLFQVPEHSGAESYLPEYPPPSLPLHRLVDQSKNCNSRTGTTDNPTRPAGQREEIWRDKDAYISCQKQGEGTKRVNSLHPPHDRLQFATPQGRPQALRH